MGTPAPKGYRPQPEPQRLAGPPACPQGFRFSSQYSTSLATKGTRLADISVVAWAACHPEYSKPLPCGRVHWPRPTPRRQCLINRGRCMFEPTRGPCQAHRAFQPLVELMHHSAPRGVAWDHVAEHRARGFFGGAHLLICGPFDEMSAGGQVAFEMVTGIFDRGARAMPIAPGRGGPPRVVIGACSCVACLGTLAAPGPSQEAARG